MKSRKFCEVEGCHRIYWSKNMCRRHVKEQALGLPFSNPKPPLTGAELAEEVVWLLDGGMSTHEVTQALGVKFSSVQTSLRRQNRRDLAVRWINLRAREEGKDERLEVDEAA
jgi:hypothetical protein